MSIAQIETHDHEAQGAIFRGIDAYNDTASGRPEPGRELCLPLFEPDGKVAGGVFGYTYYDWLHLQMLEVPTDRRGQGLGTALLRAAEAEASRRGCHAAWVETDPEAAGFLAHRGWREFGRLDDGLPATHEVFLRHDIAPGGPTADPVAPADIAALKATMVSPPRAPLGLLLHDDVGQVEGGLWGWSERGRFFVQLLFVPQRLRHQRLGTRLIARACEVARRRGCRAIWLDTFSFQARPFYERLGFSLFGTLADYPLGGARYFLVKRLQP